MIGLWRNHRTVFCWGNIRPYGRMTIAWRTFVGALNAIGSLKITVRKLFRRFANENNVWKQAVVLMIMNIDSAVLPT